MADMEDELKALAPCEKGTLVYDLEQYIDGKWVKLITNEEELDVLSKCNIYELTKLATESDAFAINSAHIGIATTVSNGPIRVVVTKYIPEKKKEQEDAL